MTIEIRPAEASDHDALVPFDYRNFGFTADEDDLERAASVIEIDRFLLAFDGKNLVAAAGTYGLDLTVPGPATVPMAGVTWVSVAASHRRQGLAGRLLAGLQEQATARGEPLLGLLSSEGGIYERFGYGSSTRTRVIELDRHRNGLHPRWRPEPVELITAQDRVAELTELWDRHRRCRPGQVSRTETQFRTFALDDKKPTFGALHPDGYVLYTIEPEWNNGHPGHRLRIGELVALTPEAHLALWNLLLSVDLVGSIHSIRAVPVGDPLPYLLTNPRGLRTVELNDGLWLKVSDPIACFGARRYRTDDRLVIGVVESVDDLVAGTDPATVLAVGPEQCRPSDEQPELVACRSALGPLLLGHRASDLARGRRLQGSPDALERADLLFGTSIEPHCSTPF